MKEAVRNFLDTGVLDRLLVFKGGSFRPHDLQSFVYQLFKVIIS